MKKIIILSILYFISQNIFSQNKNNLDIGLGVSWMSEVLLKRGYRLDAEYNRQLKGRLGYAVNVNMNYSSGVGFDFTVHPADSGFLVVGNGIKSVAQNSLFFRPVSMANAHTWQVFHVNAQLNLTLELLNKPSDRLYLLGGLLLTYSSQTQIQEDIYVKKIEQISFIDLPNGSFKIVVPNYVRYYDIGLNIGCKYKHYFKNNFSIGAKANLEWGSTWGIFSFSTVCGVKF
jgi:hypothetical protein